jgi:hypothetical protein
MSKFEDDSPMMAELKRLVPNDEERDMSIQLMRAEIAELNLAMDASEEEEEDDDYGPCIDDYDDDPAYAGDGTYFAFPGSNSALRAATPTNPRNLPCPTCEQPNRLTPADRARGYQCDSCADRAERGWEY